jgi:hypothetical protein
VLLRRALRTVTLGVDIAVFLWRRYGSTAQGSTVATGPPGDDLLEQDPVNEVADETGGTDATREPMQTVRFGLDGQDFEIELSDQKAAELREIVGRYTTAARQVGRRTKPTRSARAAPDVGPPASEPHTSAAIRVWARSQGHHVSDRGPIPATIRKAYDARDLGHTG